MSQELLAIIEQIEREKGIKKEVLIEAVESALLSAAKRVIDLKPDEELKVELDRNRPYRCFNRAPGYYSEDARSGKRRGF
jgi:N utilization substance protein A